MKKIALLLAAIILIAFSDINAQTKNVEIDQRLSNGEQVGVLKKWEGSYWSNPFSPGSTFDFPLYSPQTILGDQTIFSGEKYNNWNSDFNNVKNHRPFDILPTTNILLSNFIPTVSGATIKTSLEGTTATGGVIEFKDPWFIDYQDGQYANQLRNRGMNEAYPRQRTSPFYPNASTQYEYGQAYRGVFLDREISPNNSYYKVGVPEEQTISVHGQSRLFYPYYWTGNGVSYEYPNYDTTGVVFTSSNATATAVLKGHLMSSDVNGISSNSQRKFVRTDFDVYHLVYESMGSTWYTILHEEGDVAEKLLKVNARNPSIDYYSSSIVIAYEFWDGSLKIGYHQFDENYIEVYDTTFTVSSNYSNFGTSKPVISSAYNQHFILYKPSPNTGLKYRLRTINSSNQWIWSQEYDVPNTDQNTLNWSVASNKLADYNIAFQQGMSTIYYLHADPNGFNVLRFCSLTNISEGTGYTQNISPSISYFGGNTHRVLISWTGSRHLALDKKTSKEDFYSMYRSAAIGKVGYGQNWGGWSDFSNYVNTTNNNSIPNSVGSIIAFSQSNGQYTKYVKRDVSGIYSSIQSLSANGIQPLISNGTDFGSIKAQVFHNSTAAPYLINQCTNDFSQGLLEKTEVVNENRTSFGRTGSLVKNGIEFLFNIGDVYLDGINISFVERIDTLLVNDINELNSAVRTNYFDLNSQSELIFSNYYYTINVNYADSLLDEQFSITFKCELVKSLTDEVIGVFDQITYSKSNLASHSNSGYLVDCSGIDPGQYYLRLTSLATDSVKMFVGDIHQDDYTLEKSYLITVGFMGNLIPLAYNLEQNYPNPFNPGTTIRYQLPQDGMVTLKVYDILGSEVATLVNEQKTAGRYEINFDASRFASGVYIYKITSGSYVSSKKMLLVK